MANSCVYVGVYLCKHFYNLVRCIFHLKMFADPSQHSPLKKHSLLSPRYIFLRFYCCKFSLWRMGRKVREQFSLFLLDKKHSYGTVRTVRWKAHEINVLSILAGAEPRWSNGSDFEAWSEEAKKKIRIMKAYEGRYDEKYVWLKSMGGFLMIF